MAENTNEYIMRDRIKIGAWGYPPAGATEEGLRLCVEAGVDFVPREGVFRDPEKFEKFLSLADEYGVEVFMDGYGAYMSKEKANERPDPAEYVKNYSHHPSFCGNFFTDEPGSDDMPWMGEVADEYMKKLPGKVPLVNLLPMYANAAQLKYGANAAKIEYYDADPERYRKHCITFCETFDTDYLCTDIYPFIWGEGGEGGKKTTYADYAECINQIAAVAREYKRKFYCCIQTFGWSKYRRTPIENEFRWQVYSMLSFGCKGILLWRISHAADEKSYESLFDTNTFEPMATYYEFKPVGLEIRALSDLFVQYDNLGVYNVNCDESTPYLRVSGAYTDFKTLAQIDTKDPLLVGCFEAKDKKSTAFTLVNMHDTAKNRGAYVKFKLDDMNKKVTAYPYGKPVVLTPADGYYKLNLAWGQGVFVTVE